MKLASCGSSFELFEVLLLIFDHKLTLVAVAVVTVNRGHLGHERLSSILASNGSISAIHSQ